MGYNIMYWINTSPYKGLILISALIVLAVIVYLVINAIYTNSRKGM